MIAVSSSDADQDGNYGDARGDEACGKRREFRRGNRDAQDYTKSKVANDTGKQAIGALRDPIEADKEPAATAAIRTRGRL